MKLQSSNDSFQIIVRDSRLNEVDGGPLGRGTPGSAAIDLRASLPYDLTLPAGETALIDTGLSLWINDPGYAAVVLPRSGLGHKKGLVIGNLAGVIDSDYQGNLMVSLWLRRKHGREIIKPMDRIAQLLIVPVLTPEFQIVKEFTDMTDRGTGGLGSTGVH